MSKLLPHELRWLKDEATSLDGEMRQLAADKSDAQGHSFDWHDNAGLDAVEQAQGLTGGRLKEIETLVKDAEIVDYPATSSTTIQLGSLVMGRDAFGDMPFVIVGQRMTGNNTYKDAWAEDFGQDPADLAIITPSSPLGSAALRATVGQEIRYQNDGGKTVTITIQHVNQEWMANRFTPPEQS